MVGLSLLVRFDRTLDSPITLFLLIAAGFVSSGSLVYDEGARSDWLRNPDLRDPEHGALI